MYMSTCNIIWKVTATNSDEHLCVYWQLKCQQGHYYWRCVQIYEQRKILSICLLVTFLDNSVAILNIRVCVSVRKSYNVGSDNFKQASYDNLWKNI